MMPEDWLPAAPPNAGGLVLFVYGTLRTGGCNDIGRFGPHSRLIGPARVHGRLHDLGPYPGMVLGGPHWVLGELHWIEPPIEPLLDELEEVWPQRSGEYRRNRVLAFVPADGGHRLCSALTYEMDSRCAQAWPVIDSGDWFTHLARRASMQGSGAVRPFAT